MILRGTVWSIVIINTISQYLIAYTENFLMGQLFYIYMVVPKAFGVAIRLRLSLVRLGF